MAESPEFDRADIRQRLEKIAKLDKRLVVLFAARCALRAFPGLAADGDFAYWRRPEGDRRVEHLFAVWRVISLGMVYASDSDRRGLIAAAADSAYAAADSAYAASAAAASAASAYVAAAASAYAAAYAADAAYAAYAADATKNILQDLEVLERMPSGDTLLSMPLWRQEIDLAWHDSLKMALAELARQEKNYPTQRYLEDIEQAYQQILKGDADIASWVTQFKLLDDSFYQSLSTRSGTTGDTEPEPVVRTDTRVYRPSDVYQRESVDGTDGLNREALASAITRLLRAPENDGHLTLGLLGDWGAGKSFLLQSIKNNLNKESSKKSAAVRFLCGDFNAWAYEHSDNLQAGIAHEAIFTLRQGFFTGPWLALRFSWQQNRLRLLSLVFAFEVVAIAAWKVFDSGTAGLNATNIAFSMLGISSLAGALSLLKGLFLLPITKELHTYLRLPSYSKHLGQIPVMRKHLRDVCLLRLGPSVGKLYKLWCWVKQHIFRAQIKITRLVYFVDDLDRCGPEGILKTLEAIRLMMDIPQVSVIIAVDHRIALAALAHHYKELALYQSDRPARAIARDYLAKIIQLPLILSKPDAATVDAYLTRQLLDTEDAEDNKWDLSKVIEHGESNSAEGIDGRRNSREEDNPVDQPHREKEAHGGETTRREKPVDPPPPPAPPVINNIGTENSETVKHLPFELKQAFRYWVYQFQLHNPRQLKRLYNSYNLIWLCYGEIETQTTDFPYSYTRMLGLILLDYMNTLSSKKRAQLNALIQHQKGELSESFEGIDKDHWQRVRQILGANAHWRQEVAAFVLPALDAVTEDESQNVPNQFA